MAIAFDNASSKETDSTTTNSITFVTAGSGRFMVAFHVQQSGTPTLTYNSVNFTLLFDMTSGSGEHYSVWYLNNPASGSNTFTATAGSSQSFMITSVSSWNGLTGFTVLDGSNNTNTTQSTSFTQSITTLADNCWTIGCFASTGAGVTASTGSTRRTTNASNDLGIFDSNAAIHPPGSNSMTITCTNGYRVGAILSLSPDAIGVGATRKSLLGVGV